MTLVGAPVPGVEGVGDALGPQNPAQVAVVAQKGIVAAHHEHDVHAPQRFEPPRAFQVGEKMRGGVVVDGVVVIAVEQVAEVFHAKRQIVAAGEGGHLAEQVGVAEGDVDGVVRAQAAAVRDGAGMRVFRSHQREHFVQDVFLELDVAPDAFGRMAPEAIEGFVVDAVQAEQLQVSGLDLVPQAFHQPEVFVLVEAAVTGGEDQHFCAGMADHEQFHVAAQAFGVPAVIFPVHNGSKNAAMAADSDRSCSGLRG